MRLTIFTECNDRDSLQGKGTLESFTLNLIQSKKPIESVKE